MLAPNAEQIETAAQMIAAQLRQKNTFIIDSEKKELYSAVGEDIQAQFGLEGLDADFINGYLLGLQTARVVIALSPAIALASVKPEDVL